MSLSGINFSGLTSGIDTETIIKQLVALQQRPITQLQDQQQKIQQQQTALNQVSALVTAFQSSAASLDSSLGFSGVTASSADETVAKVTATSGAQVGTHSIKVTQIAQSQKIASTTKSPQTDALGVAGQFIINGKAVKVAATDSLQNVAASINNAQAGVSASIISPAVGSYRLLISSTASGTAGGINLSNVGAGTLLTTTLGLIGTTPSIQNPVTNGAASNLFTDSATSVGTLLGQASPPSGNIQINGVAVTQPIDFSTDSLAAIAGKINSSSIAGVTASVSTVKDPVSGTDKQQLQIVGASGTPTFTDNNNVLANLGIIKYAPVDEVSQAKDATFNFDGIPITRSSNTVSDVLSGVTIQLVNATNTPTTEFTVASDVNGIKSNIGAFVSAYNQLASTVGNLSSFDPDTLTGGPLFGDVTVQNVLNEITDSVTGQVPGLTGTKTLLSQIGITLDKTGQLNVSDADLTDAIQNNLQDVSRIFRAAGVASDSAVSFISATSSTKNSASTGYQVNVSQVATQATVTAGTSHSVDTNPDSEVLTFSGAAFGTATRTLILSSNITLDGIISQINADTTLKSILTASKVGGNLALTAKNYGSGFSFSVSSSQAAAANNSGIGNVLLAATGTDIIGTINGESATGKGQLLTGSKGNANTDGLLIRVNSQITGTHGNLVFTQGLAAQSKYVAQSFSDSIDGTLTKYASSLGDQVTDINAEIKAQQDRITDYETGLRTQFASMESAISQIKSAGNALAGSTTIK